MSDSPETWFALRVRVGSEASIVQLLNGRGLRAYAPTQKESRRYSDRMKKIDKPIFAGYVFCSFDINRKLPVISCPGVDYIVGFGGAATVIPEEQIEAIRRMVAEGATSCERLSTGDRVRVTHGPLAGIEATLVNESRGARLVVSIELLNRGVSLVVEKDHVALVHVAPPTASGMGRQASRQQQVRCA
jgi:transcription termination/antitermination protein NusG